VVAEHTATLVHRVRETYIYLLRQKLDSYQIIISRGLSYQLQLSSIRFTRYLRLFKLSLTFIYTMGGAPPRPTVPRGCEEISDLCPVEGTIYGYTPSLPANAFFAGFFGIAMILHIIYGVRYKTWTYMIAIGLGCLAECGGYVGRVLMHNNPWNDMAFNIQIVLLIFAPSFLAAGIYLTLKHVVLQFGEEWSRIRPAWYTYIFITCDISSLAMQSAGGAMAAMADPGEKIGDIGTNLMIAGIIWQVVGKNYVYHP
jgi:hypothetical protein